MFITLLFLGSYALVFAVFVARLGQPNQGES